MARLESHTSLQAIHVDFRSHTLLRTTLNASSFPEMLNESPIENCKYVLTCPRSKQRGTYEEIPVDGDSKADVYYTAIDPVHLGPTGTSHTLELLYFQF